MKLSLHCPEIKRQIYPEIKFTVGVGHYYAKTYKMSNIYRKGFESRLLIKAKIYFNSPALVDIKDEIFVAMWNKLAKVRGSNKVL